MTQLLNIPSKYQHADTRPAGLRAARCSWMNEQALTWRSLR
jgi:hypothetical protein